MNLKKETKEIKLKLNYFKSNIDRENGIYYGGVEEPKYINELFIDIADDFDFDMDTEEFVKNGMFAIELSGTQRALKELGKFLINIAMFKTDDEDYHEHLDQLQNKNGEMVANMIVSKIK